jgi:hypothetical protein
VARRIGDGTGGGGDDGPRLLWDRETRSLPIDRIIARELAKIELLERTYWDAWVRSCAKKLAFVGADALPRGVEGDACAAWLAQLEAGQEKDKK